MKDVKLTSYGSRAEQRKPIQVFCTPKSKKPLSSAATLAAIRFIETLAFRYRVVWIDLESHHTVSGIVSELFNRFRESDPHCPHISVMESVETHKDRVEILRKVASRVCEVLARGRHVVVFDSVESFGRTQMMHHGTPTYDVFSFDSQMAETRSLLESRFQHRVTSLYTFLELICVERKRREIADSYIVITMENVRARRTGAIQPASRRYAGSSALSNRASQHG